MKQTSPRSSRHMSWQTGPYARRATFSFILPAQFLMFCRLMDITPETLISDFMETLAGELPPFAPALPDDPLKAYVLQKGFGQQHYTPAEITAILEEMRAIASLFPAEAAMPMIDLHSQWRKAYHQYWFDKWLRRQRPK